jgi:hypothetical protein
VYVVRVHDDLGGALMRSDHHSTNCLLFPKKVLAGTDPDKEKEILH